MNRVVQGRDPNALGVGDEQQLVADVELAALGVDVALARVGQGRATEKRDAKREGLCAGHGVIVAVSGAVKRAAASRSRAACSSNSSVLTPAVAARRVV
jgi:hypothetical protein